MKNKRMRKTATISYSLKVYVPIVHIDDQELPPGSRMRVHQATIDFNKETVALPSGEVAFRDIVELAQKIALYSPDYEPRWASQMRNEGDAE